jgi:hypothetical protein
LRRRRSLREGASCPAARMSGPHACICRAVLGEGGSSRSTLTLEEVGVLPQERIVLRNGGEALQNVRRFTAGVVLGRAAQQTGAATHARRPSRRNHSQLF